MADNTLWRPVRVPIGADGRVKYDATQSGYGYIMADQNLFRAPDENSGPAVLGREPVVLPEARKNAMDRVRDLFQG